MAWAQHLIAVDWGTTNRRAWRLADGAVTAEMEDDRGILVVGPGGFDAAVAEIRGRLGDLPMLLAGMVGSNRGWVEAPYVRCPAGLDDLTAALAWPEPRRTCIVPGVAYDAEDGADVMRGEEVQLLGAVAAGLIAPDAPVCHPGTHNKWALLRGGRIVHFRTVMTGELFNLLKSHSILSDLLQDEVEGGDAFRAGVRAGLEQGDVTAALFGVRAGVLLGRLDAAHAADRASGLLIGADLRTGLRLAEGEIVVMGRPDLVRLYSIALAEAGRGARAVGGEEAFLAGPRALAEKLA